jgi:hypothetical protein
MGIVVSRCPIHSVGRQKQGRRETYTTYGEMGNLGRKLKSWTKLHGVMISLAGQIKERGE